MSKPTKPSIVFCHGIWADGSCFNKVIPALQAEGYEVIAAQYGLDTPEEDVATVERTLGRVSSPAILVGHSYGGSVITAAGTDERVAGLVYIAALAPDADETSQSQQAKFPVTDVFKRIEVADGRVWLRPEGVECFAGDLSEQEQKIVYATHYAPAADLFSRNAPGTAWKSKPTWYIVANNDRSVHPGSAALLSEAYGCIHPRCRQQPRSDVVPPQLRRRCCPRRGKSSSWIIRCSLSRVSAISAESKTESSWKEKKSQPRRFSTTTQGRDPTGGFTG
jgi:pimeloyl-ACP methyl ester carboxylesterase